MAGVVLGIILVASLAILIIQGIRADDNENEEQIIEWAGDNSPLAGIQFLTSNGLTFEQYSDFYNQLTDYFAKKHPDYKYVEYVYNSFDTISGASEEEAKDCVVDDVSNYAEEEIGFWNCTEDELATTTLSLKLRSDTGDEYSATIEPDYAKNAILVHLYDATGQELL